MSESLPSRVLDLANEHVDGANFTSPDQVMVAALTLFKQYQTHHQLRDRLRLAGEQLKSGEYEDMDSATMQQFFESVKTDGRGAVKS
jgi:hypothetical protein